ncbi:ABC transporter permease [Sinomonas halotolerans]|uniref:ABC transporter permease n=1 Tax=Sinomonas halotolerans TaxID=1644133 RepID=A0ABU9X531_9MICC
MSATSTEPAPAAPDRQLIGPSFPRVLAAEALKARTVLSTPVLLASAAGLMVGFAALQAWGLGQFKQAAESDPEAAAAFAQQGPDVFLSVPAAGVSFSQLIVGSLAVILIAGEFTTGLSRATFAAVPRRLPVLAAKLLIVVVLAFAVTYAGALVGGLAATPIMAAYDVQVDLASWGVQRDILLNGAFVAAVAAMGLALGALLRNSAGAIVTLVAALFVLPIIAQLIPGDFFEEARKYLPTSAANAMLQAGRDVPAEGLLEPGQGALVLAAYVAVLLAGAFVSLAKRDV